MVRISPFVNLVHVCSLNPFVMVQCDGKVGHILGYFLSVGQWIVQTAYGCTGHMLQDVLIILEDTA